MKKKIQRPPIALLPQYSDCSQCIYGQLSEFGLFYCLRARSPDYLPRPNCLTNKIVCIYEVKNNLKDNRNGKSEN